MKKGIKVFPHSIHSLLILKNNPPAGHYANCQNLYPISEGLQTDDEAGEGYEKNRCGYHPFGK